MSHIFDPVRLELVRRAGLLDRDRRPAFDRLARLIARLLHVPIGAVTILDAEGQTFIGATGLPDEVNESRSFPLSHAYCRYVVESGVPLLIGDTRSHPIGREDPAILENGVQAYMGIPIVASGEVVGTLCAIDMTPHAWTGDDLAILNDLVGMATAEVELGIMKSHLEGASSSVAERDSQLAQDSKMDALGRLASGIAHDFNNMLTVISVYGGLALSDSEPGTEMHENLTEVETATRQAAGLTRQLLSFSRKNPPQVANVDVNVLVSDLGRMLSRIIPAGISINTDLEPEIPPVYADKTHIEQVLMNLAVNARDAMPDGGELNFSTRASRVEKGGTVPAGDYVVISVKDSGSGIPDSVRAKIFDPFFTTKGEGKGTGLGLATVKQIVERLGGRIEVETAPGKGTEFRISFPRAKSSA